MQKKWLFGLLAILAVLLGFAYINRDQSKQGESITAVGSTALQPLVEAAGEEFSKENAGVFVNVQGGGSGTGLSQIEAGAISIGNSDLFASEQAGINANKLTDHRVAVIGVTPIINKQAGIDALTTEQLKKIFTGKVTNWRQVGGENQTIVIVNRTQGSGTRNTFEKWGLNRAQSIASQEQDSSGTARQIVATTPGAISYVSFSYADSSIITPTINGVKPTNANVKTNRWQIWSYEHMYTQKQATKTTTKFINFVLSDRVQTKLIPQLGYIPISEMQITRLE
ncbi:phosphate ABC transporter substrate-binding protein PstS family protein [Paucilactobacillus wasatchensis]|uniref:Phosphate-binding protein n=1 Tax=Paucilactobacillus wasatchensis TaxID=1335616 RepID=A0A0D1A839_9LACO|nr:phosphate ABC transporter substrate-binding protein PstS family protein [Paucilactobacillus wasatchensis]KIS02936.1 Phosphate ABC transporter, periplasmic phosphate-binding protein PstS [Paucilactobacillus wasatchensis]